MLHAGYWREDGPASQAWWRAVSRVLVLDDDWDVGVTVAEILEARGHAVECARSAAEAMTRIEAAPPDVILLDVRLAEPRGGNADGARDGDGIAFAEAYRRGPGPHAALVLFTALPDAAELAEKIGARAVLPKPFRVTQLLEVVERGAAEQPRSGGSSGDS